MYRESNYNFFMETANGFYLLYNSRTGAFASLPLSMKKDIEHVLKHPDMITDTSVRNDLVHGGFLVDESTNEFDTIKDRFIKTKYDRDNVVLVMLASENCNFRCPYCFVYAKRGYNMKKWVYSAVLKHIENVATSNFNLRINWFGGEPTLAENQIIIFMEKLNELAKMKNFKKLSYGMVTNGYLLTKESCDRYMKRGLNSFQVTLDGDAINHDRTRYLKNGKGTFDAIWKNLLAIKEMPNNFELAIRANFLKGRDEEMHNLIEKFITNFADDKRYYLYFRPVYNFETERRDICKLKTDILSLEEGLYKQIDYNMLVARRTGRVLGDLRMVNPVPKPITSWCNTEKDSFWIIGADGLLFKCDSLFGEKNKASAKLQKDGSVVFFEDAFKWGQSIYDESDSLCLKCRLLPICQGGCTRRRKLQDKSCYLNEKILLNAMLKTHYYHREIDVH